MKIESTILTILEDLQRWKISPEQAMDKLRDMAFIDLDDAKIDALRQCRQLIPEVVFGRTKSIEDLIQIAEKLIRADVSPTMLTRLSELQASKVIENVPGFSIFRCGKDNYMLVTNALPQWDAKIGLICAGTSDVPILNEAYYTLKAFGIEPIVKKDIGVAGLERLLTNLEEISDSEIVIVIAGMDGALASVAAGIFKAPIIAVPTSVGYGTVFDGLGALLSMMNSCSPGVVVTGVDNGFGAAAAAIRILNSSGRF